MLHCGAGGDGKHAAIGSWVWNSWTPDPAGTGGILSSDYVTIDWAKVDYLDAVGLFPWYTLPTAHRLVSHATTPFLFHILLITS